jgi:hypothetical protein
MNNKLTWNSTEKIDNKSLVEFIKTYLSSTELQRLKQYGDNVYLNNNEEFELEIFNPLQNKIKASITINNTHIGDVVIRPGQRAFLERFLKENKKFLFQTYLVENNNPIVDNAIKNNGVVNIKFYQLKKERFNINDYLQTTNLTTTNNPPFRLTNSSNTVTNINYSSVQNSLTTDTVNLNLDNSPNTFFASKTNVLGGPKNKFHKRSIQNEEVKETGTIEKGDVSSQTFTYDDSQFELFSFKEISWKILPQSQKINHIDEIVSYCGECGAKRKKENHKFCPHCGTKY